MDKIDAKSNLKKRGASSFTDRLFDSKSTLGGRIFDAAIGIGLPLICLVLDPAVFQGGALSLDGVFAVYRPMGYAFIFMNITALGFWLVTGWLPAIMGGIFLAGALFCLVFGILLLPFSLMGLVVLIGILGFSPFLVFFVYFRNAVRAFRKSRLKKSNGHSLSIGLAAFLMALFIPLFLQVTVIRIVDDSMERIVSDEPAIREAGMNRLKRLRPLNPMSRWIRAYFHEMDEHRKQLIADSFQIIEGMEIETVIVKMWD